MFSQCNLYANTQKCTSPSGGDPTLAPDKKPPDKNNNITEILQFTDTFSILTEIGLIAWTGSRSFTTCVMFCHFEDDTESRKRCWCRQKSPMKMCSIKVHTVLLAFFSFSSYHMHSIWRFTFSVVRNLKSDEESPSAPRTQDFLCYQTYNDLTPCQSHWVWLFSLHLLNH